MTQSLGQFTVAVPERTGPYTLLYVRYGRTFVTLEAAERTARRMQGRVMRFGSNEVIADFGIDLTPEPVQVGRQSRGAALSALLGLQS